MTRVVYAFSMWKLPAWLRRADETYKAKLENALLGLVDAASRIGPSFDATAQQIDRASRKQIRNTRGLPDEAVCESNR